MKGAYRIEIGNQKVRYELTVRRNITIIRGESGSGKTTLINLLSTYGKKKKASGIKVNCDKACKVLDDEDWEGRLALIKDSIIFIDESNSFIKSHAFARAIANTDNYYVIITRNDISTLAYSIREIYKFRSTKRSEKGEQVYTSMQELYSSSQVNSIVKPTMLITEDSNAGYSFFNKISIERGIKCISASGKSNIQGHINKNIGLGERVLLIADGAAFGNEMKDVMELIIDNPNYTIYLPESFEWLILKSGIIRSINIQNILQHPEDYIDSTEYISWERYFTSLLEEITEKIEGIRKYNKTGTLDKYFTTPKCIEKILQVMEGIELENQEREGE